MNAARPQNIIPFRTFLGLINYYSVFISDATARLQDLHSLLK